MRPEVPTGDGTAVPDVPTDDSGVYAPIAPMGSGSVVGADPACGSKAADDCGALDGAGVPTNDGARLAVVPASLPVRGRS
jgi:hypothetical protein